MKSLSSDADGGAPSKRIRLDGDDEEKRLVVDVGDNTVNPEEVSDMSGGRLQALVYGILPPTTAVIDFTTGLEQLSANGQLFIGVQMAVSLSQVCHRQLR